MSDLLQDVRYAARALLRQPAVTLGIAFTLALGVGLNGAVFSVVNAYLFKPLPVRDPQQLVLLGRTAPEIPQPHEMSWPDIEDQGRLPVYTGIAAWVNSVVNLGAAGGERPERAFFNETTANFFSLLGVQAMLGRTFAPGEDQEPFAHRVIVLDHDFWRRHFNGDSSVIGRTLAVNGRAATIIGVLPASFQGVQAMLAVGGYMPLNQTGDSRAIMRDRDNGFLNVIARMAPGVTFGEARAATEALGQRTAREHPDTHAGTGVVAVREARARPLLFISRYTPLASAVFLALTALVLIVACANVTGLLLSRATARERELAVRSALGAGRGRIARLLLIESLMLGALGGLAALGIAVWGAGVMGKVRIATDAPIRFDVAPDWRVFAVTLLIATLAGVVAGLVPALRGARANLGDVLRAGTRAGSVRQRLRSALVIAQVAVAVVVLAAAGMFLRSVQRASAISLGFRTDNVLLAAVSPGDQGYNTARVRAFAERFQARVAALPGVQSVAIARRLPLGYSNSTDRVLPEGGMPDGGTNLAAFTNVVDPAYFATMNIPIEDGRAFTVADDSAAPRVAIVSRAFAAMAWPGGGAIGRRFRVSGDSVPYEVVGVAGNTVYMSLDEEPRPFIFYPFGQRRSDDFILHVATATAPAGLVTQVRSTLRELDADLPLYDVRSMHEHLEGGRAFFSLRFGAAFAALFGALALVLGAVGLFGLIAFGVAQRTREIGIRLALGANASGVQGMMLRRGLVLVVAGLAFGLPLALLVGRGMQGLLVNAPGTDLVALGGSALLLLLVAGVAAWLPARRAAAVDPMIALRSE